MGVRGLYSYVQQRAPNALVWFKLHNCTIVIDGNNLAHLLYAECGGINAAYGGDYDRYARFLEKFLENLQKCEVTPIVVVDGGQPLNGHKLNTHRDRMADNIANCIAVNPENQAKNRTFPPLARQVFVNTFRKAGVLVLQTDFEADTEIAVVAKNLGCSVLSNDSDFFIYGVPVITLESLNHRHVVKETQKDGGTIAYMACYRFSVDEFCDENGMNPEHMPILGTVLGNDYVGIHHFLKFYSYLEYTQAAKKKKGLPPGAHRRINNVIFWLRQHRGHTLEFLVNKLAHHFGRSLFPMLKRCVDDYRSTSTNLLCLVPGVDEAAIEAAMPKGKKKSKDKPEKSGVSKLVLKSGNEPPSWFIRAYRENRIPHEVTDILTQGYFFSPPQVEMESLPSSYLAAERVVRGIYTVLWKGLQPNAQVEVPNYNDHGTEEIICRKDEDATDGGKNVKPPSKSSLFFQVGVGERAMNYEDIPLEENKCSAEEVKHNGDTEEEVKAMDDAVNGDVEMVEDDTQQADENNDKTKETDNDTVTENKDVKKEVSASDDVEMAEDVKKEHEKADEESTTDVKEMKNESTEENNESKTDEADMEQNEIKKENENENEVDDKVCKSESKEIDNKEKSNATNDIKTDEETNESKSKEESEINENGIREEKEKLCGDEKIVEDVDMKKRPDVQMEDVEDAVANTENRNKGSGKKRKKEKQIKTKTKKLKTDKKTKSNKQKVKELEEVNHETEEATTLPYDLSLKWYIRKGRNLWIKHLTFLKKEEANLLPSLDEIEFMPDADKKSAFYVMAGLESKFNHLDLPGDVGLILDFMGYWLNNTQVNLNDCHVLAVMVCFFTYYIIDGKIGRVRTKKEHIEITKNVVKLEDLMKDEKYKDPNAGFKNLIDQISVDECSIAGYNLFTHHQLKCTSNKYFRKEVVHAFSEYQACVYFLQTVNSILGFPFPLVSIEYLWGGTFAYNVYVALTSKPDRVAWVQEQLGVGTCIERLFSALYKEFDTVHALHKLPCASSENIPSSRQRKKEKFREKNRKRIEEQKLLKEKNMKLKKSTEITKNKQRKMNQKEKKKEHQELKQKLQQRKLEVIEAELMVKKKQKQQRPSDIDLLDNRFASFAVDESSSESEEELSEEEW